MIQQLILHKPVGNNPSSDAVLLVVGIIFGFLFPLFFLFSKLVTEVRDDGLYFRFYPFHRSFQKIEFMRIKKYEVRTYRAFKEYGGWGIRYSRNGKAYNVGGNEGVQLELINGERILIGSGRPDELLRAISDAIERGGKT